MTADRVSKNIKTIMITVISTAIIMVLSLIGQALIFYGKISVKLDSLDKEDIRLSDQHKTDQQNNNLEFLNIHNQLQNLAQVKNATNTITH